MIPKMGMTLIHRISQAGFEGLSVSCVLLMAGGMMELAKVECLPDCNFFFQR